MSYGKGKLNFSIQKSQKMNSNMHFSPTMGPFSIFFMFRSDMKFGHFHLKKVQKFCLFLELNFRPTSKISRRAALVDKYLGGWTSNFYIIMAWRWYVITRTGLRIYEFGICPCLAVEYYWNKLFQIFLDENVFDFSPNWNNISFYFNYQYFSYWLLKPDFLTEK